MKVFVFLVFTSLLVRLSQETTTTTTTITTTTTTTARLFKTSQTQERKLQEHRKLNFEIDEKLKEIEDEDEKEKEKEKELLLFKEPKSEGQLQSHLKKEQKKEQKDKYSTEWSVPLVQFDLDNPFWIAEDENSENENENKVGGENYIEGLIRWVKVAAKSSLQQSKSGFEPFIHLSFVKGSYSLLAMNWAASLDVINATNYVIVAFDDGSFQFLNKRGK